jgi:hypothetical protein
MRFEPPIDRVGRIYAAIPLGVSPSLQRHLAHVVTRRFQAVTFSVIQFAMSASSPLAMA